jgi:hypothetical protein
MQDFSRSMESDGVRDELSRAIHGAGAFRNFKDTVSRLGIEPAWFAFRADALRQIALEWCEENRIVWRYRRWRIWVASQPTHRVAHLLDDSL